MNYRSNTVVYIWAGVGGGASNKLDKYGRVVIGTTSAKLKHNTLSIIGSIGAGVL